MASNHQEENKISKENQRICSINVSFKKKTHILYTFFQQLTQEIKLFVVVQKKNAWLDCRQSEQNWSFFHNFMVQQKYLKETEDK